MLGLFYLFFSKDYLIYLNLETCALLNLQFTIFLRALDFPTRMSHHFVLGLTSFGKT